MADTDPTQEGGQDRNETRLSQEEQIAAKVDAAMAADRGPLNEDGAPDEEPKAEEQPRDEHGRFAEKAEAPEPEEPAPAPAPAPAVPAPAEGPRMATITVDGQQIEVEESRLLEAGKRLLQKETAADKRLQEAAKLKREAEEYSTRVGYKGPSQDAPPTQALSQDVQPATFSPEMLDSVLETKIYNREAQKAAEKFKQDFPEIAADPHLMNMAATLENQRLATVTALGESLGDPFAAYRKHGESIQQWLGKYKPAATSSAEKIERKRTIVAVPAANAKAPAPQEDKPETVQDIIRQQRAERLQGRPLPIRSH